MHRYLILFISISLLLTSCSGKQEVSQTFSNTEITNTTIVNERDLKTETDMIHLTEADSNPTSQSVKNPESHPKFELLKKDQNLLTEALIKNQDSRYQSLIKERISLIEGEAIWTPEIIRINAEFNDAILRKGESGSGISPAFVKTLKKKDDLISIFRTTQEYKNYITANSSSIQEIDTELKTYLDPEIQALQGEIQILTEEIYGVIR